MPVSIVMPAYNGARHLEATLQSVQAQTYSDWELVIVDDGSKDETAAIARSWSEADSRIRVISQENAGVSAARNRGIQGTDPARPCLVCLDSDDLWVPSALEVLMEGLIMNPGCSACYGAATYIDAENRPLSTNQLDYEQFRRRTLRNGRIVSLSDEEPTDFAALNINDGCRIVTPGQVLARREAVIEAGCFEAGLGFCEDWDLWLRMSRIGPLAFVRQRLLHYRVHPSGASNKKRSMVDGHRHVRRKTLALPGLTSEERRAAEFGYRYYCRAKVAYALQALKHGALRECAVQGARALVAYRRCISDIRASRKLAPSSGNGAARVGVSCSDVE